MSAHFHPLDDRRQSHPGLIPAAAQRPAEGPKEPEAPTAAEGAQEVADAPPGDPLEQAAADWLRLIGKAQR